MMKTIKKSVSILLSVIMVFSLFTIVPITASAETTHTHHDITFEAWTATDSLPASAGDYYLADDVEISATWTAPTGSTNLCLNGHTIRYTGTSGSVIQLNNAGQKLTVCDCGATGGSPAATPPATAAA